MPKALMVLEAKEQALFDLYQGRGLDIEKITADANKPNQILTMQEAIYYAREEILSGRNTLPPSPLCRQIMSKIYFTNNKNLEIYESHLKLVNAARNGKKGFSLALAAHIKKGTVGLDAPGIGTVGTVGVKLGGTDEQGAL